MTKRLTLVGLTLVAAVWGPYVYAELARQPLEVESEEVLQPVIVTTPVAYEAAAPGKLERALSAATQPAALPSLPEAPEETPPSAAAPGVAEPEPAYVAEALESQAAVAAAAAAAAARAPNFAEVAEAPAAPAGPAPPAAATPEPAAPPEAEVAAAPEPAAPAPPPEAAAPAEPAAPDTAQAKTSQDGVGVIPDELVPAVRSAFAKESRDVMWASREEPRITKLLSGAGIPNHAISEVRCQSTVCRVAFNSGNLESAAQTQLYERIRQELGPAFALDPTGQEQHAAFYVLRTPQ